MLFDQAVYEYLEDKQHGRKPLRPNTLEGYMSAIKCHLMPQWSGREVESISCDEMQTWIDSFVKPGAARKAFNTLRQIYRWYLRTYKVRIWDETQAVELPSAPRRKPRALTAKQANAASAYAPTGRRSTGAMCAHGSHAAASGCARSISGTPTEPWRCNPEFRSRRSRWRSGIRRCRRHMSITWSTTRRC